MSNLYFESIYIDIYGHGMGLKIRNYPFMKDVTDKELAHFDDGLFTTFLRDWYFASGDFHQQKTRVDEM